MQPFEAVRTQRSLQYGAIAKSSAARPQHLQRIRDPPHGRASPSTEHDGAVSRLTGARSTTPTRSLNNSVAEGMQAGTVSASLTPQPSSSGILNKSSFSKKTVTGRSSPARARASSPTRKLAPIPFPGSPTLHQQEGEGSRVAAEGAGTRFHVAPAHQSFRPKLPVLQTTTGNSSSSDVLEQLHNTHSHQDAAANLSVVPYLSGEDNAAGSPPPPATLGDGARVSDYFIPVTDHKRLVKEQDEEFPAIKRRARTVEIPVSLGGSARLPAGKYCAKVADISDSSFTPGALACVVTYFDEQFFNRFPTSHEAPAAAASRQGQQTSHGQIKSQSEAVAPLVFVDLSGQLVFDLPRALTGKTGITSIRFKVVDYSSPKCRAPSASGSSDRHQIGKATTSSASFEFDCSDEITIDIVITATPAAVVAQHQAKGHADASAHSPSPHHGHHSTDIIPAREVRFLPPELPASVPGPCRTLQPLCIHTFRTAPETSPAHTLVVQWLKYQPIFFTKCTSISLERELLTGTQVNSPSQSVTQSDVEATLLALHGAMNQKQSVAEVIVPLLDHSIQQLLIVASDENLSTMKRLVGVRAELVASLAGVNLEELCRPSAARNSPAQATRPQVIQSHLTLLVRVAVESGHLMKMCGDYASAKRFYTVALAVAELLDGNLPAETHIPFARAIGDAELLYGDYAAAAAAYERARALAEMAQKSADLSSETPSLAAAALVLSCEADVSTCYALQHRHDAALHSWNRVEHMSYVLLASPDRPSFLLLTVEAYMCGAIGALSRNSLHRASSLLQQAQEFAQEYASWDDHVDAVADLVSASVGTLLAVVKIAMALAASQKSAADECSALLLEAFQLQQQAPPSAADGPARRRCDDLHSLVAAWVGLVASFPLQECPPPQQVAEYDALMPVAAKLTGVQSPLYVTMSMVRSLSVVADGTVASPLPSGSLLADDLPLAVAHPLRFDLYEAVVTCAITHGDFAEAVDALHRASTVWESCKMVRSEYANAVRLLGIGAYAVTNFIHEKTSIILRNQARHPQQQLLQQHLDGSNFDSSSFREVVNHVVDTTLHDTRNVSFERLLDAAEVRLCESEFGSSLDLLGKALRFADSRNVMFLLDGLFVPRRKLSRQELEDRTRLLQERRVSAGCLVSVGLVLFEIAVAHESCRSYAKAKDCYEQAIAALEMLEALDHPAAVEILTGLGRVHLLVGDVGDALLNLEWAQDIFLSYHFRCGAYEKDEALKKLAENLRRTQQAAHVVMRQLNYVLAPHESLPNGITVHV